MSVWFDLGASAMHEHDEVLEQLRSWQDAGHRVAVATVVSTWGSSPRPVGSQLGVNDAGEMVGSVSGGCIEGAVVKRRSRSWRARRPSCSTMACRTSRPGKSASPAAARGLHRSGGLSSRASRASALDLVAGSPQHSLRWAFNARWPRAISSRCGGASSRRASEPGGEHIRLPPLAIDKAGRLPA